MLAFVALATSACSGDGPEPPTPPVRERCTSDLHPPEGFDQRRVRTVRESDHLGIRILYTDATGRMLASLAGISGEYGEGSPFGGHVEVAGDGPADLFGDARRWTIVWAGAEPCTPRAVIGNGFTKEAFLRTLTRIGVLAKHG